MKNGTIIVLPQNDPNLIRVIEKWGATHQIEAVLGTRPRLDKLEPNQSVCWGDGEHYHFRLTTLEELELKP